MIEARQKLSYRCGDLRARLTSQINDYDDALGLSSGNRAQEKGLKSGTDFSGIKRKKKRIKYKTARRHEKASYLMVV